MLAQPICDLVVPHAVVALSEGHKACSQHPQGKNGFWSCGSSGIIEQDSPLGSDSTGEGTEVALNRVMDLSLEGVS